MSQVGLNFGCPKIAIAVLFLAFQLTAGSAQAQQAIGDGDAAVSSFSGTVLSAQSLAPGVDPVDKTVIDVEGPAVRVFDMTTLGGPPSGQLVTEPAKLEVKARDIGQVFGLAFDEDLGGGAPNLYAAASSAYGIQIVDGRPDADGTPVRLHAGAPGARFMEGQFGSLPSAGPGSIWRIDGTTGAVTLFADTANSGPGLGGLAFDPRSRSLYASDLDTGLIHRFSVDNPGASLGQFDHGLSGRPIRGLQAIADDGRRMEIETPAFRPDDTSTWGMTQPERRVHGLAVFGGRIYYAVADGPEIWSVDLDPGGNFGADVRFELLVQLEKPLPVTGIVFDSKGRMTLALRGTPVNAYDYGQFTATDEAPVLRYARQQPDFWAEAPESYAVGFGGAHRNATGGASLQYGYDRNGRIDFGRCEATLMATGDALPENGLANGVQINATDLVRPANAPPWQSAFVSFDPNRDDPGMRGHVGNVQVFRRCERQQAGQMPGIGGAPVIGFPPVVDGGGVEGTFPPVVEGGPLGNLPQTIPMDEGGRSGGPLRIEKSAISKSCGETKDCSFKVVVTNTTDRPVAGPVIIQDIMTAGGVALDQAKIVNGPNAPWSCISAGGTSIDCSHPGPIPAKGVEILQIGFLPGPLKGAKEVRNCAAFVRSGDKPAGEAGPPPPPGQPLKVVSKPTSKTCSPIAGECEWETIITNAGAKPLNGTLNLTQTLFPASDAPDPNRPGIARLQSMAAAVGWSCSETPPPVVFTTCSRPNTTLTAGAAISLRLSYKIELPAGVAASSVLNRSNVELGDDRGNTAESFVPLDPSVPPKMQLDAGDQQVPPPAPLLDPEQSCASIPVDATKPEDTQAGPLQIAKKAVGNLCDPITGQGCDFEITITNMSAAPFKGPVEFDEMVTGDKALFGATEIKSGPTPPWVCGKAGQGFKCSNPDVTLPANASTAIKLGVALGAGTGAVQKVENCVRLKDAAASACAEIATQQGGQPLPPQEQAQAQLKIEKNATVTTCGVKGGGCSFEIVVTNTGATPFNGPIEINDITRMLDADGAVVGTALINTPAPGAPWTCAPNGQAVACSLPPSTTLAPGQKIKLNIAFKPSGNAEKAVRMENCARLKSGGVEACDKIILSKKPGAKLRPEKTLVSGDCSTGCDFRIRVRNVGNEPYSGEISLNDVFSENAGGAQVESQILAWSSGAWQCTTPVPTVHNCRLTAPVNAMQPGASVEFVIRLKVNRVRFDGQNCVFILSTPDSVRDNDQPGRCAPVSFGVASPVIVKNPPELLLEPKLKVEKQAPNADGPGKQGHCSVDGLCRFQITVTNVGLADFRGEVTVYDDVQDENPEAISQGPGSPAGWKCYGFGNTAQLWCDSTGLVTIPKGTSLRLEVAVTAGKTWANAESNLLKNCAEAYSSFIDEKGGRQSQKQSNKSCATVKLDPFAVSIKKTGDQSCQPGGLCRFDLDVFNNGQIPHDDPVTVSDKLSGIGPAQIVSITGALPFPCTPAPTQLSFTCTSPGNFPLMVGEHRRYTMTVRLPEGPGGAFTNCATISPAEAGQVIDAHDIEAAPGSAAAAGCHTVVLAPARVDPPPPACVGGMVLSAGRCSCPPGTAWSGRRCSQAATPPASSGGGYDTSREPPPPASVETRPQCPRGKVMRNGKCVSAESERRAECPPSRPVGQPPNCCPQGTRFERGKCRQLQQKEQVKCRRGTEWNGKRCVRPAEPAGPSSGDPDMQRSPLALCPPGTFGWPPLCRPIQLPKDTSGKANTPETCPLGMTGVPPNCCRPGTRYVDGVCQKPAPAEETPVEVKKCPPGTFGRPPLCRPVQAPVPSNDDSIDYGGCSGCGGANSGPLVK